jgi:hypothetical protein
MSLKISNSRTISSLGIRPISTRRISGKFAQLMTTEDFRNSLAGAHPPPGLDPPLTALWYAGKGYWGKAHAIAQDIPTREGSWVHAWLHRQEGDQGNAHYWYNRAGRKMPQLQLEEEWTEIVRAMLSSAG